MKIRDSKITDLTGLVVFSLFALCILGVLLAGAGSYKALTRRGEAVYENRTAVQYLTTRVRQGDREEGLQVEDFCGCSALVLRQEVGGETYLTRIYCHDGYLRELFTAEDGSFSPEDGEKLLEMKSLAFEKQGNTLFADVQLAQGDGISLRWCLRSEGVQP